MKKILIIFVLLLALVGTAIYLNQPRAFSHAPDYSWVAGQLYWSNLEGGFWGIRYGEVGSDKYNGHFVLGAELPSDFKDGDLVRVKGQIAEQQVSIFMAGWIYKVEEIKRLK